MANVNKKQLLAGLGAGGLISSLAAVSNELVKAQSLNDQQSIYIQSQEETIESLSEDMEELKESNQELLSKLEGFDGEALKEMIFALKHDIKNKNRLIDSLKRFIEQIKGDNESIREFNDRIKETLTKTQNALNKAGGELDIVRQKVIQVLTALAEALDENGNLEEALKMIAEFDEAEEELADATDIYVEVVTNQNILSDQPVDTQFKHWILQTKGYDGNMVIEGKPAGESFASFEQVQGDSFNGVSSRIDTVR